MALSLPSNPTTGQFAQVGDDVYRFDGAAWTRYLLASVAEQATADLSDSIAYLAKAIEQRLPMPDTAGRTRVDITSVSGAAGGGMIVTVSGNNAGNSLVGVGGTGITPTYSLNHMPFALANQGAAHLYAQITVI